MKHIAQLDAFRAFSVMFVLFSHFVRPGESTVRDSLEWGRMGVLAFFVLSGYLITGILLEHRRRIELGQSTLKAAWRSFLIRRTLRIFPLYFFVLFLFGYVIGVQGIREHIWTHVFYVSNFGQAIWRANYGIANHFWSLCVEEQFYLVWPLGVLTLALSRSRSLCGATLAISVLSGFLWVSFALGGKFINYIPLGAPSFALALGGLASCGVQEGLNARRWSIAAAVAALVLASVSAFEQSLFGRFVGLFHDLSWSIVAAWIVLMLRRHQIPLLSSSPLVWLGKVSYGIYVYHLLLTIYFPSILARLGMSESDVLSRFLVKTIVTIVVASLSYVLLERPFLRLKDRIT